MAHTGYIRLRAASLGALEAITAPRGTEALLTDGRVFVQMAGPTGANWKPLEVDSPASYGATGCEMRPLETSYNLEP